MEMKPIFSSQWRGLLLNIMQAKQELYNIDAIYISDWE